MASTRRLARTATVLACSVALVVPAGAAMAAPPEHAPAHGRQEQAPGPSRTTSAATADQGSTGDARPARGGGRAQAPGQQKKQQDPERRPAAGRATPTADPARSGPGRAPVPVAGRGGQPAPLSDDAAALARVVPPLQEAADSAPARAPEPAPAPLQAAAPAPAGTGDVVPTPVAAPTTSSPAAVEDVRGGRRVIWPDLDGPFRDLLRDVTTTIGRVVPRDLGPVREPLAEVVPLLLALLGAFLALQRGIGRGLGQVPMVAVAPRHDVVRHAR